MIRAAAIPLPATSARAIPDPVVAEIQEIVAIASNAARRQSECGDCNWAGFDRFLGKKSFLHLSGKEYVATNLLLLEDAIG